MRAARIVNAALMLAALAALLPLAGCDSFGLGASAPTPPPSRALDYRQDDLASVVFALDLPADLQPVQRASTARFDITTAGKGDRHLKATLVLADGDSIDGELPPPAAGRTYYLLGFADRDKQAIAGAQKWLAGLPPGSAPVVAFDVTPKFCETAAIDPSVTKFSVLPALPGAGPLLPLVNAQPVTAVIGGGQVPPCGSI
jgi:hypothetical protein